MDVVRPPGAGGLGRGMGATGEDPGVGGAASGEGAQAGDGEAGLG